MDVRLDGGAGKEVGGPLGPPTVQNSAVTNTYGSEKKLANLLKARPVDGVGTGRRTKIAGSRPGHRGQKAWVDAHPVIL